MSITLGITGSIAAYKAAELPSQLVKRGHGLCLKEGRTVSALDDLSC